MNEYKNSNTLKDIIYFFNFVFNQWVPKSNVIIVV